MSSGAASDQQLRRACALLHAYIVCEALSVMTTELAGYSGTPLGKKLGIKPSFRVKTKNAPSEYGAMVEPLPEGAVGSSRLRPPVDIYHVFSRSRSELDRLLRTCRHDIHQGGMIWVSWPKKSSRVSSNLTENVVRELALPLGLVDVKVCAIDGTWSGLKLVIRKELRK